jgi:hypothetical protein
MNHVYVCSGHALSTCGDVTGLWWFLLALISVLCICFILLVVSR